MHIGALNRTYCSRSSYSTVNSGAGTKSKAIARDFTAGVCLKVGRPADIMPDQLPRRQTTWLPSDVLEFPYYLPRSYFYKLHPQYTPGLIPRSYHGHPWSGGPFYTPPCSPWFFYRGFWSADYSLLVHFAKVSPHGLSFSGCGGWGGANRLPPCLFQWIVDPSTVDNLAVGRVGTA